MPASSSTVRGPGAAAGGGSWSGSGAAEGGGQSFASGGRRSGGCSGSPASGPLPVPNEPLRTMTSTATSPATRSTPAAPPNHSRVRRDGPPPPLEITSGTTHGGGGGGRGGCGSSGGSDGGAGAGGGPPADVTGPAGNDFPSWLSCADGYGDISTRVQGSGRGHGRLGPSGRREWFYSWDRPSSTHRRTPRASHDPATASASSSNFDACSRSPPSAANSASDTRPAATPGAKPTS